jgi:hypothetical protein
LHWIFAVVAMTVSALDDNRSADQLDHRIRQLDGQHSPAALTTHLQPSILIRMRRPYELRMLTLSVCHIVQEAKLANVP